MTSCVFASLSIVFITLYVKGHGESLSAQWAVQRGQLQETPHGSPQTSRPRRPDHRGLDEEVAGGHEEVGQKLSSPLLGVQKPWHRIQGKRYQEGLLLDPPAAAAVAWHVGVVQVPCRSRHASNAGQPGGGGDTGWRLDQVKVERRVPPLWEVKE